MEYCDKSISANYFRGMEAVGGKIYFDEKGITFKSHSFNIQTGNIRIEYMSIDYVEKRNTLGIVPNGMLIVTKDGIEHKFVISHRKEIIEYIQSKCKGQISNSPTSLT